MKHDPELVDECARLFLDRNVRDGHPAHNPDAWLAGERRRIERELSPEYVTRAVAGMRARAQGRVATGWREVRGTHAVDYVPDPFGTDRPPWL